MAQCEAFRIDVASEVQEALRTGKPVVAMESCVLAQGLPRPMNMSCAQETMEAVRSVGAVPAIVAVIEGVARIGIGDDELRLLCRGKDFSKASCDDLPGVLVKRKNAATTVSASLVLAERAGIKVFTTGGLGGISPHCSQHFDASSDLLQLTRTRMAVICSGVKSVLDVSTSVECLETLGIPVALYRTLSFPCFFARGIPCNGVTLEDVSQVADFYRTSIDLLGRGVVVANPAPADKLLSNEVLDSVLNEAMEHAELEGHTGKSLTPFLLDYIARKTQGATLETNRALLLSNARLAAELACELQCRAE